MLWPINDLNKAYLNIREMALGAGCTVLIFVAQDCDALCACRILTQMLRSDNVAYKVKPVSGYEDIMTDYELLVRNTTEIRSVVMLNCGGDIDLMDKFPILNPDSDDPDEHNPYLYFYINDSRRPYNHMNLMPSAKQVIVFGDDGDDPETILEVTRKIAELGDISPEDLDDSESDSDSDSDSDSNASDNEDIQGNDGEQVNDNSRDSSSEAEAEFGEEQGKESGNGDDHEDEETSIKEKEEVETEKASENVSSESAGRAKRSRTASNNSAAHHALSKKAKRSRLLEYYRGTYWGQPASLTAQILSQQLNKSSNSTTWLSIVGTTHHYITGQMEHEQYNVIVHKFEEHVKLTNPMQRPKTEADDGTVVPVAESSRLECVQELKLMLHRHWSLYNSLFYSEYVASRLGIWKSDGKANLQTFLAKMGISLKECQQKFSFMSARLKAKLRDKIEEHAHEFRLDDMLYNSFQCQAGFDTQVSAADVVYSIQALLEQPRVHTFDSDDENKSRNSKEKEFPAATTTDMEEKLKKAESHVETMKGILLENFNQAYDSLVSTQRNVALLQKGLKISMDLQRAVVSEGIGILEGKLIQSAGDFRYAILERLDDTSELIFSQPQSLYKLAKFLVKAHVNSNKWVGISAKPFILGIKSSRTMRAYFVGLQCSQVGEIQRNAFGRSFKLAASKIEAEIKHNGFDSASIEVDSDDVHRFLVSLHDVLTRGV